MLNEKISIIGALISGIGLSIAIIGEDIPIKIVGIIDEVIDILCFTFFSYQVASMVSRG